MQLPLKTQCTADMPVATAERARAFSRSCSRVRLLRRFRRHQSAMHMQVGGLLCDGLGDGVLIEPEAPLAFSLDALRVASFGLLQVWRVLFVYAHALAHAYVYLQMYMRKCNVCCMVV